MAHRDSLQAVETFSRRQAGVQEEITHRHVADKPRPVVLLRVIFVFDLTIVNTFVFFLFLPLLDCFFGSSNNLAGGEAPKGQKVAQLGALVVIHAGETSLGLVGMVLDKVVQVFLFSEKA